MNCVTSTHFIASFPRSKSTDISLTYLFYKKKKYSFVYFFNMCVRIIHIVVGCGFKNSDSFVVFHCELYHNLLIQLLMDIWIVSINFLKSRKISLKINMLSCNVLWQIRSYPILRKSRNGQSRKQEN